ncbi:MAG TPA: gamma-glutamyl-gamma-aminobutyrate hydrolase family protein [Pyrinomonadaceae bacterium]|nr:gamma-glutamyl-gamma-aminobutyrate hydrolase family protein [Pyrinomonadaceae bacterium]
MSYDKGQKERMKFQKRPRIGITMRLELETNRFYLARYYSEAVESAGGLPVLIPLIPRPDFVRQVVADLDGLLLPGSNSDIDPLRYGREPHSQLGEVHPEKDETDLLALAEAEDRAMPLFAICFGLQALNVSRGGTLIQDIVSQHPGAIKHEQGAPRDRHSHRVRLLEDSRLGQLANAESAPVNSHHHQAIETLGRELVATAWASDGIVEAVEDPRGDRFVLGVQWHPELGWERDEFSQSLFNRFIAEATEYAEEKAGASETATTASL